MPVDVASGAVHLSHREITVPGKVDLVWEYRFSSIFLDRAPGCLGSGWASPYDAAVRKVPAGFEVTMADGSLETLSDPEGLIDRGGLVPQFGAFLELFREHDGYVIRQWKTGSNAALRYCFQPVSRECFRLAAIEDLSGQGLDVVRDAFGRVAVVRQRLERRELAFTYGAAGFLQSISLRSPGHESRSIARYEYSPEGRLTAVFDALEYAERYAYEPDGHLRHYTAKDGGVFSYRYDRHGRCVWTSGLDRYDEKHLRFLDAVGMTEVTDSYGSTYRYRYGPTGQIESEWDPLGAETKTQYDAHGRIVATVAATGAATRYEYDDSGNLCRMSDPLGNVHAWRFNEHHQVIALFDAHGNAWTNTYDHRHRLSETRGPLKVHSAFEYDDDGNVVTVTNARGGVRRFEYEMGVLVQSSDWSGHATYVQFDPAGRLAMRMNALGHTFRYFYDAVGNLVRVVQPNGTEIRASYSPARDLTSMTDTMGRTTVRRYGPCRRLRERIDPNGHRVTYEWGTEPGRIERFVNERHESYRWEYDAAGQCVQEISFDGRVTSYAYDRAGWCTRVTNGAGETIQLDRDPLGRILRLQGGDGRESRFTYDALGNLVAARNAECSVAFERDAAGRVVRETQGEHWVRYAWDASGAMTSMETDLGHRAAYEHGTDGRWARITLQNGYAVLSRRDAAGREVQRQCTDRLVWTQSFDSVGHVIEQSMDRSYSGGIIAGDGQPVLRRHYGRDASGSIAEVVDSQSGREQYRYDASDRLTEVTSERGVDEEFSYDPSGNISRHITMVDGGRQEELRTYDAGNRLVSSGTTQYQYDAQGRLVERTSQARGGEPQTWRYAWDRLDQLTMVVRPDGETWRYGYDALGRRVRKSGPGAEAQFVWAGNVPVHQLEGEKRSVTTWVFEPGTFVPLATTTADRTYTVSSDYAGTPREMWDGLGSLVWRLRGLAYGDSVPRSGDQVGCPLRFQGQYRDAESGLHYNRFRYYDPAQGRYVSPDPLGLKGGQNLYLYAANPLAWVDPFGLCPIVTGGFPAEEEAAIQATLGHIDAGTTPTGPTATRWGIPFQNREGNLPGAPGALPTPYTEYRVAPAPGTPGAGPRRIVVDHSNGNTYYTWTHYGDAGPPAFVRIR